MEHSNEIFEIALKISEPIEVLDLDIRIYGALKRHNIKTIADIYKKRKIIPDMRNIGVKSLNEINFSLEKQGLAKIDFAAGDI